MDSYSYSSDIAIAGVSFVYLIIYCVIAVFALVCMWKIFVKANLEGWKCLIPFYNAYCLYKITWGNGWFFLLLLIPFVNIVIGIITLYKLAVVFGKGIGFFFGLLFLNVIFLAILAFSDATYQGIE